MTTPMLHWPDSMMTYVKEEKLLLSNDGFGQHLASDGLFVNEQPLDLVVNEAKSYYANILFPYGAQAEKALNTAGTLGLDIEMIAPSHGCIWSGKDEVNTILGLYAKWASGKNEGKAVVVYDSMWGRHRQNGRKRSWPSFRMPEFRLPSTAWRWKTFPK